jgi:hypothetical protein
MKLQDCQKLYQRLDRLIEFNKLSVNRIKQISLIPDDFKLFTKYNVKQSDGAYHYRNLAIRQK